MRCGRSAKRRKVLALLLIAASFSYLCFQTTIDGSLILAVLAGKGGVPEPEEPEWTKSVNRDVIVYNRLPKCASTTTRLMIARVQSNYPHRFKIVSENAPRLKQILNVDEQEQVVRKWSSVTSPTIYIRHLRFLNFTKFGHKPPVYINFVRDPVEQFVSAYYFMRFGFVGWSEKKIRRWLGTKPDRERYMSLEQCVAENVTECVRRNPSRYFSYFCGHDEECSDFDRRSLERAKVNLAKYYAVVGIAEEYEKSLWLLENRLPNYFNNITNMYRSAKKNGQLPGTRTARKTNPPVEVKEKLREALHLRVEFYEFIKRRFERQYRDIHSEAA